MVIRRGDIRWVDLGPRGRGSAPAGRRPVVVVQHDAYTRSALRTVIIAVVTSNTALAELPGNVFLPATASGLPKDSVVNTTQLLTLDEDDLGPAAGRVPVTLSLDLDAGLRRVLHL
ncbi:type II toxin-antitoxin system PemK/MazF family toxin [Plantibacter sp. CFBP 8775]|nr:type II toxin-antitoxin system PemK/MazF family toxin [Plantibacter sp. CFBP 8775]MBD8100914.1 type II toxin-antitoxin system PemK/MazF family toxin [Plantibacter sp. CFBP 8775]